MRLLLFIESVGPGGKERQFVQLVKGLERYGDIICEIVVLRPDVFYDGFRELSVQVHCLSQESNGKLCILSGLNQVVKKFQPNIIHNWGLVMNLYTWPLCQIYDIRSINGGVRFAGKVRPLSELWFLTQLGVLMSDVTVANSQAGLKLVKQFKRRKHRCIYNGFDRQRLNESISENSIRGKYGIDSEYVIGMVSNYSTYKDIDTVVEACQLILKDGYDICAVFIGDGFEAKNLRKQPNEAYRSRFSFLGPRNRVEEFINIFDVCVLASRSVEGFSNSVMEYMAQSKAVVATDVGGTKELVLDGENGMLARPGSAVDLANKITHLLDDTDLRKTMGLNGKSRIIEEFTQERMVKDHVDLYRDLLRG